MSVGGLFEIPIRTLNQQPQEIIFVFHTLQHLRAPYLMLFRAWILMRKGATGKPFLAQGAKNVAVSKDNGSFWRVHVMRITMMMYGDLFGWLLKLWSRSYENVASCLFG